MATQYTGQAVDNQVFYSGSLDAIKQRAAQIYINRGQPVPSDAGLTAFAQNVISQGPSQFEQLRTSIDSGVQSGALTSSSGGTDSADQQKKAQQEAALGAQTTILSMLDGWGLGALGQMAWSEYLNGVPMDKIMQDIRSSDTYKQRFPGMAQLQAQGQAISEADYISKEATDTGLLRAYGVTALAGDRAYLGSLIGNQVSSTELQQRLDDYNTVVNQLPKDVSNYLGNLGVNSGDLIHFWLDPSQALPMIEQKTKAAEVGGAAQLAGYGPIDAATAMQLGGMGVNFNQAMTGFGSAAQLKQLTQTLPGQAGGAVSGDQLVGAELTGNGPDTLAVKQAQDQRLAQFKGNTNYVTSQAGVTGLAPTDF